MLSVEIKTFVHSLRRRRFARSVEQKEKEQKIERIKNFRRIAFLFHAIQFDLTAPSYLWNESFLPFDHISYNIFEVMGQVRILRQFILRNLPNVRIISLFH